jgi:hypothetical protein
MRPRLAVVPSVVPALVLVLGIGGQVKEQLAVLALAGGVITILWSLALIAALVFVRIRKAPAVPVLAGLALAALAILTSVTLIVQAPLWVQWRAEPAIAALEAVRGATGHYPTSGSLDGDFPSTLRATLEGSGHCVYKPRGASYALACLGVPFVKCSYESAHGRWSGCE